MRLVISLTIALTRSITVIVLHTEGRKGDVARNGLTLIAISKRESGSSPGALKS